MRLPLCLLALVFIPFAVSPQLARADTITESILVHAQRPLLNGTTQSFDLSFLLTFDPGQSYTDATSGLTLVSATSVNGAAFLPSFYVPSGFDYTPSNGGLIIGGLALGVSGGNLFTNDYEVLIGSQPSTSRYPGPYLVEFAVSSTDPSTNGGFILPTFGTPDISNTAVSITQVANPVPTPEPSSLALLSTALLCVAGGLRKRFALRLGESPRDQVPRVTMLPMCAGE